MRLLAYLNDKWEKDMREEDEGDERGAGGASSSGTSRRRAVELLQEGERGHPRLGHLAS